MEGAVTKVVAREDAIPALAEARLDRTISVAMAAAAEQIPDADVPIAICEYLAVGTGCKMSNQVFRRAVLSKAA